MVSLQCFDVVELLVMERLSVGLQASAWIGPFLLYVPTSCCKVRYSIDPFEPS